MNQKILQSPILRKHFNILEITFSFARNNRDFGRLSLSKVKTFFAVTCRLLWKLISKKPAAIYFQLSPFGIAFIRDAFYVAIMKLFGEKIIFHIQGKGIRESAERRPLFARLYRFAFRKQFVISFSKPLAADVAGIYSGAPFIIPNGIDAVPFDEFAAKRSGIKNCPNILFLSNYREEKGVFDFIDALGLLQRKGIPFAARMVGNEGKTSIGELESRIQNAGLAERIQVLGPKLGYDKNAEYLRADIFVFPTRHEAFGNVAIEAMQFALPVIASNEGSLPEIVDDGKTGYLFPKGDVACLAVLIERLIADPDMRRRMGQAGRNKFLDHYTFQHFESSLMRAFDEVLRQIRSPQAMSKNGAANLKNNANQ